MNFAVIKTGGKQYLVQEGTILDLEKFEHNDEKVQFDQVLLVVNGEKVLIGQPLLKGVAVSGTVLKEGLGEKKMVFRYKSKTRYKKKKGHRQPFIRVKINKISAK